jgi:hypothetical protein
MAASTGVGIRSYPAAYIIVVTIQTLDASDIRAILAIASRWRRAFVPPICLTCSVILSIIFAIRSQGVRSHRRLPVRMAS